MNAISRRAGVALLACKRKLTNTPNYCPQLKCEDSGIGAHEEPEVYVSKVGKLIRVVGGQDEEAAEK